MPRVVPSDVVATINRMFRAAVERPDSSPEVNYSQTAQVLAVAQLVDSVPEELLILDPGRYAELIASVAYLRGLPGSFRAARGTIALPLKIKGFELNSIALIHRALAACPDEAPAVGTVDLAFITDDRLRESIRLDLSAAHRDLSAGEWKGATVLAGSATEALLLWVLQAHEGQSAGTLATTAARLFGDGTLSRRPPPNPEDWMLHMYVEVAAALTLIAPDTATMVRLAKDFRNLIHPGRAARLGQKCDRPTALAALAAAEAVARDLTP